MTTMRKASPHGVAAAIRKERRRQDRKWGNIDEHPHTVDEWLAIISTELGEAYKELLAHPNEYAQPINAANRIARAQALTDLMREVLHVTAVGVACLEQHGLPKESSE